MVQVIDPPIAPQVLDYEKLFAAPQWTGYLLTPTYRHPARLLAPAALSVLGAVAVARFIVRRGRTNQPPA
jgi:hypothetical protein